jgi:hypothetical protein
VRTDKGKEVSVIQLRSGEKMKNYLWVIEFNGHPNELKTSWTPIMANPDM